MSFAEHLRAQGPHQVHAARHHLHRGAAGRHPPLPEVCSSSTFSFPFGQGSSYLNQQSPRHFRFQYIQMFLGEFLGKKPNSYRLFISPVSFAAAGALERCSRPRRWWRSPAGTTATASAASSAASPSTPPRCATGPTTRSTAASATAGSGQSAHLPEFPPTEPTFPTWAGNLNFNHCLVCCRPATGISLLAPTLSRHPVIF